MSLIMSPIQSLQDAKSTLRTLAHTHSSLSDNGVRRLDRFLESLSNSGRDEDASEADFDRLNKEVTDDWISFDGEVDKLFESMIETHKNLSSIPARRVVKPAGTLSSPLVIQLHYPPARATREECGVVIDPHNPCIGLVMAKLGLNTSTITEAAAAAIWLERFYGRIDPKKVGHKCAEVGLPYGGQAIVDIHQRFTENIINLSTARIVLLMGSNNVKAFIKDYQDDKSCTFLRLFEQPFYGQRKHACLRTFADGRTKLYLFAYHPEAHIRGLEDGHRFALDVVWDLAAFCSGNSNPASDMFRKGRKKPQGNWQLTFQTRGLLDGCRIMRAWELNNGVVLESAKTIPKIKKYMERNGIVIRDCDGEPPISIARLILSNLSKSGALIQKAKRQTAIQKAKRQAEQVKNRVRRTKIWSDRMAAFSRVPGNMSRSLQKAREILMRRSDEKWALLSEKERAKKLKQRQHNKNSYLRLKARMTDALRRGVPLERISPDVTRRANSDEKWRLLPAEERGRKLRERAKGQAKHLKRKARALDVENDELLKALTPAERSAKRRNENTDALWKEQFTPEEVAKKQDTRTTKAATYQRKKALIETAKANNEPVEDIKVPHLKMVKSDQAWALLPPAEREKKLKDRAKSKKSYEKRKREKAEAAANAKTPE